MIDSGIDPAHPDLYLNIWLNPGELRDGVVDVDLDGVITFYDLNNLDADLFELPSESSFADGPNADLVNDFNANGRIDALDLLEDPLWANGIDDDGNGFVDDLFGWNFRSAFDEPFSANNPSDVLGHGTHVSGTIGAIGNNSIGVTE